MVGTAVFELGKTLRSGQLSCSTEKWSFSGLFTERSSCFSGDEL